MRLWKVDVSVPWRDGRLFAALLAALLAAFLAAAAAFLAAAAGLLTTALGSLLSSTFFSCHKLLSLLFSFWLQPQDTVSSFLLWPRVSGAQHVGI